MATSCVRCGATGHDPQQCTAAARSRVDSTAAGDLTVIVDDDAAPRVATPPPAWIGRYEVSAELGRGGMGVVYRAEDPHLRRTVAIKLILDVESPDLLRRFGQEARAVAKLRHPAIVALHEAGQHEGKPFLVMDFVEGESLEATLRRRRVPPRETAAIVREVALAHAHEQGVVHRDVKPQNVLLDPQGRPHLLDFGLARDVASKEALTQTGQILGTLQYMAPEQASGEGDAQGPHTDIYALGAVLYRALTGEPVFPSQAGHFAQIKRILLDEPTPPRRLDASIHPDLETIALRCLEKDPPWRYPSATAVADELGRFLAGEAIVARPLGRPERLRRWARRNRALTATLAASGLLVVGLLATGLVGAAHAVQRISEEHDAAVAGRRLAETERRSAEGARADADRRRAEAEGLLRRSLQDQAALLVDRARHPQAWALLARCLELGDSLDVRLALGLARARSPRRLLSRSTAHTGRVAALTFDADGRRVRSIGGDGVAVVFDVASGEEVSSQRLAPTISWARERSGRLVTACGARVTLWGTSSGDAVAPLHTLVSVVVSGGPVQALAADGDRLAVAFTPRPAGEHPVALSTFALERPREPRPVTDLPKNGIRDLALHPDGRLLAASSLDATVRVHDLVAGTSQLLRGHTFGCNGVDFTDDGALLASGSGDGTVRLWDARQQLVAVLDDAEGGVVTVAFGPGVDHPLPGCRSWLLAAGAMDLTVRLWRVTRSGTDGAQVEVEPLVCLPGHPDGVETLVFSRDGTRLASRCYAGRLQVWDLGPLLAAGDLRGHAANVQGVAFSPDGRRLASCAWSPGSGEDPRVLVWSPGALLEPVALEGHTKGVIRVAFDPRDPDAVASASEDGTVRLWSVSRRAQTALVAERPRFVRALAFGPRGLLAWGDDGGTLAAIDLTTGAQVARFELEQAFDCAAFGRGGRLLATGDWTNRVRLWSLPEGRALRALPPASEAVVAVAVSPDGRTVASGARVREVTVKLWDVESGALRAELHGHRGEVDALAFHPRLPLLASGAADDSARLWLLTPDGGVLASTLKGQGGGVQALAFSPAGERLATGGKDGVVRLWDLSALEEPREALLGEAAAQAHEER